MSSSENIFMNKSNVKEMKYVVTPSKRFCKAMKTETFMKTARDYSHTLCLFV